MKKSMIKKSIFVLASLGVCAGSASAQSSVTIYGVVDMSIQHENDGVRSKTALDSGQFYGSRIGFKGSEDLGGGLKANFVLENGFNADDGSLGQGSRLFGRASWVGLSGDFGAVRVGRMSSPIFIVADAIDPFDAGLTSGKAGQSTSTNGMLGIFRTAFRTDNTLTYNSNNIYGFSGAAAYTFGETAGNTSANRQIGLSLAYDKGPVYTGIAYQSVNDIFGNSTKQKLIGGTYNFGIAKAALAYQKNSSDLQTVNNKNWMVGVTVPVGPASKVLASYIRSTDNTIATANSGSQWALGYTYDMSKRTTLYTSYSGNSNQARSNIGGLAAANGLTDTLFNAGIRHKF
ncbi:porin [Glaciimonas sp. PCH181]|nr:porin [Glaciimonas sp. PCH181]